VADDGRGGQLINWGVAIRMVMRHERPKRHLLPVKEGQNREKGIQWESFTKGSSVHPLRHMSVPSKAIAVLL